MGVRQDQATKKYQPVVDLMDKEGLSAFPACEKLHVNYAAFMSWNRRRLSMEKIDGRTKEGKKLKQQGGDIVIPKKRVRKKSEPEMVTFQVPQKKGFMVCLVGDSEEIARTLETISKLGVQ